MINFFKNGLMPHNTTSAVVSLTTVVILIVLYAFFSDFFINASILLALLAPLMIGIYYLINLADKSIEILMG